MRLSSEGVRRDHVVVLKFPYTMSVDINPGNITGKWEEGYFLDLHTLSSTFLGYNAYGHPDFDTKRSALGELLYKLKYGAGADAVESVAETVVEFLRQKWPIEVDLIVPVPPSNMARRRQPVLEIAKAVSVRAKIELCTSCIKKIKQTPQLKNVYDYMERAAALEDAFRADAEQISGKRILLFDDLFRSGATMNSVAERLIEEGGAKTVYALTLTRTRSAL